MLSSQSGSLDGPAQVSATAAAAEQEESEEEAVARAIQASLEYMGHPDGVVDSASAAAAEQESEEDAMARAVAESLSSVECTAHPDGVVVDCDLHEAIRLSLLEAPELLGGACLWHLD